MRKTHPYFLVGGNGALYEFPNKGCFQGYCRAMARGDTNTRTVTDEDLAELPADVDKEQCRELWSRPMPVSPQDFSAVFLGRSWDMGGGSLEPKDWEELNTLLEYS